MANHALPLKTIGDAIAMRAHVMRQLEKADLAETEAERHFYLTFIVVGGGFSGVEVAGSSTTCCSARASATPTSSAATSW
jgi:NADH dehydrogenase